MSGIQEEYAKYGKLFMVDEAHYREFCELLEEVTFKKSDFFLRSGDECYYLAFLKKGFMRTFYINENGTDVSFNFHFDNHFFTDYDSVLRNTKSKMNIVAVENSTVLLLHKRKLNELYQKDIYWQEFGRKMNELIYLNAHKRIEELLYYSPEIRYKNLLQMNSQIFQLVAQKHIASYLGIKPESLSRIRSRILKR